MKIKKKVRKTSRNVYTEYPAGKQLAGIADFFWSFRFSPLISKRIDIHFVPTHQTSLAIVIKNSKVISAFFHGPTFKRKTIRTSEPLEIFAVNLAPFAGLKYFRLSFNDLMGKPVRLQDAAGKQDYLLFKEKIEKCANAGEYFSVYSDYLFKRMINAEKVDNEIEKLCSLILNSHGEVKLEKFYKQFSSAARQLQRKFKKIMAFTPKEFARLVRIQQSGTELVKSGFRHFDVLYKYGYYDQSHYIKEFKKIMGSSPKDFEFSQKKIDFKYIDD